MCSLNRTITQLNQNRGQRYCFFLTYAKKIALKDNFCLSLRSLSEEIRRNPRKSDWSDKTQEFCIFLSENLHMLIKSYIFASLLAKKQ